MISAFRFSNGYQISRIIKGGWHLAGDHGPIDRGQALLDMAQFVEAGITSFDCADIYTGVEQLIGDFRRAHSALAKRIQVHTKFVPDLSVLATIDRSGVEAVIDRSLQRLGMERLDLVQFHWWDFAVPRFVEVAYELERLRHAGKIAHIGATNFDTAHLKMLVDAGIPITAHQVQYSLVDDRPAGTMVEFCARHGIGLLCYGTVAGGFFAERWLNQPDPGNTFSNRSLIKYKLIIDDFGGWELFQRLLRALSRIAQTHATDIASIATAQVLCHPEVAAAIVGATSAAHLQSHERIAHLVLDAEDRASIDAVIAQRRGPVGDIYELERDRRGRHGQIMKYELSSPASA